MNSCAGVRVLLAWMLIGLVSSSAAAELSKQPPEGFEKLFNGENLEGWFGRSTQDPRELLAMSAEEFAKHRESTLDDIRKHWSVKDGVLINDGHGLFLTTNRMYGDFELLLEYKTVPKADSGIYLRGLPQVQIWDTTEAGGKWGIGAKKGSGGLWNNSDGAPGKDPLHHADRPFGEWNSVRIVMVGERVSVWLNDKHIVDHARLENYFDRQGSVPRRGPIQLQTHGGKIEWRNIFVREIKPKEANRLLVEHDQAQREFVSLFNGRNLDGWSGPIENYAVDGEAIVCKPGKGGTIYTDEEYGDFEVLLQFQLPPGGNNGLAIRYPGKGDTAYVGMCELQVLDSSHAKYKDLDPRQHHGSIYGQVAARRGYLRNAGDWNYQRIRVQGSRITVELNGTVILDADNSKLSEFMYPAERFAGRHRRSGHFGFAGHSDPVRYRQIYISPL